MPQRTTNHPRKSRRPAAKLTPLDYMLSVVNNPRADPARRDRLAVCAAQYCHPRSVEFRKTKRELLAEAAKNLPATEWDDDLDFRDGRRRQ